MCLESCLSQGLDEVDSARPDDADVHCALFLSTEIIQCCVCADGVNRPESTVCLRQADKHNIQ